MILLVALALVVVSVPLGGGHLSWLALLPMRAFGWVVVATALQILVVNVLYATLPGWLASGIHLASYGCVVAFLLRNRHVVGLWLIGLGGFLNLLAIATNGGVMPARGAALAAAGLPSEIDGFTNSAAADGAPLWFLGDVFAWPAPLPLANVFSVGDLILVVGAAVVLHVHAGSALGRRMSRRRRQAVLNARRDRLREQILAKSETP